MLGFIYNFELQTAWEAFGRVLKMDWLMG